MPRSRVRRSACEVVGPLCESSDIVGKDREMPPLEVGDLVAVRGRGRLRLRDGVHLQPPPAAVRGDGGRRADWRIVRRRQTVETEALEWQDARTDVR